MVRHCVFFLPPKLCRGNRSDGVNYEASAKAVASCLLSFAQMAP